jgi:nanoRNase/pAp phosphatase (c-di-AMP/oligoRNAs hydrolase)
VDNPDTVAQVADMMLTLRRMTWSASTGRHKDTILVSLRTTRVTGKAGRLARGIVSAMGTAGGHDMVAGGQITCAGMTEKQRDELEAKVVEAFFRMLGKPEGGESTPLVPVEKEKEEIPANTNGTTKREEVNR